ncbi:putative oxidoreductase OrdL [Smittium mucronatum]|uniref:Putative oxidoreductase OrdL n=1 Tax=Smittium mucronatum TaxID=133383 RepID=A0A1R0H8L6_9FUNG|nr:putative oxidoreductase OrdL [Smittium mucronatum]
MLSFKDPGLPSKNPSRSVWLDENPLKTFRSSPEIPKYSDIVIIGSGLSGSSIAYHLLVDENTKLPNSTHATSQRDVINHKPSVIMLEAREACGGATGRNGGHIIPDNHRGFFIDSKVYPGRAMEAAAVRVFEQMGMNELESFVKNEGINCEFRAAGNVEVYETEEDYAHALKELEEANKWGISRQHVLTKEDMLKELGTDEYVGAIKIPSGQMYPARIVWHLIKKSIENGLKFYTYSPVVKVREATAQEISSLASEPNSVRASDKIWCVETEAGEKVLSRDVIHATNAYASHLLTQMRERVFPVRAQIISTSPKFSPKLWPFGLSMRGGLEYAMQRDYPNGRMIFGGFRTSSESLEVDNPNDSEINPKLSKALRHSLRNRVFRSMDYMPQSYYDVREWTGIMGFSDDDAPYVGQLYDSKANPVDGQWVLVGLSAHGMPRCFRCGREVARRVCEKYMSEAEIKSRKSLQNPNPSRLLGLARFNTNPELNIDPTSWATNGENDIDDWDYNLPRSFIVTPQRMSSKNTVGWDERTIFPPPKSKL